MLRAAVRRAARHQCPGTAVHDTGSVISGGLRPFSSINYDTNATDLDALFNETLVRHLLSNVAANMHVLTIMCDWIQLHPLRDAW